MSRRRRQRSVELHMPRLGHVVVLHTSKISPYTARGHYICSCKDLCETKLSRCEMQIGLCAAIVVLELADLQYRKGLPYKAKTKRCEGLLHVFTS